MEEAKSYPLVPSEASHDCTQWTLLFPHETMEVTTSSTPKSCPVHPAWSWRGSFCSIINHYRILVIISRLFWAVLISYHVYKLASNNICLNTLWLSRPNTSHGKPASLYCASKGERFTVSYIPFPVVPTQQLSFLSGSLVKFSILL